MSVVGFRGCSLRALFLGLVPPVFGGAPIFVSVFLGGREGWLMFLTWKAHSQSVCCGFQSFSEGCSGVVGWFLGGAWGCCCFWPPPPLLPPPPPSLLPPLGWCVVVWVVLCTRTLHLAGYWVVVDMCTRIVLKVEFNLGSGVLGVGFWGSGGWVFTLVCYRGLQGFEDYAGCCGGFYGGMLSLIRQLVCAPSTVVVVLMF